MVALRVERRAAGEARVGRDALEIALRVERLDGCVITQIIGVQAAVDGEDQVHAADAPGGVREPDSLRLVGDGIHCHRQKSHLHALIVQVVKRTG